MICHKHGVEMREVPRSRRWLYPLHRCPLCAVEFRAVLAKAMTARGKYARIVRQIVWPPVMMSERWP